MKHFIVVQLVTDIQIKADFHIMFLKYPNRYKC